MPQKSNKTKKITKKKTKKSVSKKIKEPKVKKKIAKKEPKIEKADEEKYFEAVGRRKTAVARIRLFTRGKKEFLVNEQSLVDYFPTMELQQIAQSPLSKMRSLERFKVTVRVKGGGIHAQAEALRHGIARALVLFNPDYRKRLKKAGFLTRDPRMRERKKFGLKRARRAAQWQKR